MRSVSLLLGWVVVLGACMAEVPGGGPAGSSGPAGDSHDGGGTGDDSRTCAGSATTIRGKVTFPNGELPVDGALVYLSESRAFAERSGTCGECVDLDGVLGYATTGPDGRFEIAGVPAGAQTLLIEKGHFRRVESIDVTACTDNEIPSEATRLPRDASEGDVPRIAVVAGEFDHMEDVLAKLGLSRGAFDVVPSGLLDDAAELAEYDVVFVNCGATFVASDSPERVDVDRAAIRDFLEGGGRLYVTDLAYDLLERSFPPFLDFHGATGNGLSEQVEGLGPAEIGDELPRVTATIEDQGLRAWLQGTGAADAEGRIDLQGFLRGWTVLDAADERAKVWVWADVSWGADPRQQAIPGRGDRPMTATFEAGCGRALFTSYHTVEGARDARSGALSAQEQALAYLVLEIGSCIEEPELY